MKRPSIVEERKQLILDTMRELQRPIWVGDVATSVSEQAPFGEAFRLLVEEEKIVRLPRAKGARSYYRIEDPSAAIAKDDQVVIDRKDGRPADPEKDRS